MTTRFTPVCFQRLLIGMLVLLLSPAHAESQTNSAATNQPSWVAGWQELSPMLEARTGAAIYYSKDHIYVFGGLGFDKEYERRSGQRRPAYLRTTEYARLNADGTLSGWQQGPSLTTERGYFAVARHNNHLYAVGGGRGVNGKELLATVERAEIKADGTLGEWSLEAHPLNIPRRCVKLAVIGDTLYAFGGYGGILLDSVEQATINPDGTLGEWLVDGEPMLVQRYVHGEVNIADGIYNIGGHSKSDGSGIADVGWSKVGEDGFFLPWQRTTSLQGGRYGLATATHNGYLYAIGGMTGATHLNTIERTKISEEGKLSPWTYTTPTPVAVGGANAAVINGKIYLLGGSDGLNYLDNVYYAGFNPQGDIGFWATPAELAEHQSKVAARKSAEPALPHQGVVVQHFKQKLYSYIQVREDNNNLLWLAAPAKDLKRGDRIAYPNGTLMRNFRSKGLNRRFPLILFVSRTQKID